VDTDVASLLDGDRSLKAEHPQPGIVELSKLLHGLFVRTIDDNDNANSAPRLLKCALNGPPYKHRSLQRRNYNALPLRQYWPSSSSGDPPSKVDRVVRIRVWRSSRTINSEFA
jgi:hypothetical protein